MNLKELAATDEAELVDILSLAQHVMAGLTRTIRLVSATITSEDLDGPELTLRAAEIIAGMLAAEAVKQREAGETAEAEVRERAIEQFKYVVRETVRPLPPQQ